MSLMLHCGGVNADIDQLRAIPLPEETKSYKPVSHHDLAMNLAKVASDLLNGFTLDRSSFGLARDGNQMFGVHTYKNGSDDLGLSIGFRNSYDKSMSVGLAIGASVFVCDNLALTGEIAIMRKHTVNVWNDLEELAITTIYRSQNNFSHIQDDAESMKSVDLRDDDAYRLIGLLFGRGILTNRQLSVCKREWLKPTYQDFKPRNLWSLYNSATEALKSSAPPKILERHIDLHSAVMEAV